MYSFALHIVPVLERLADADSKCQLRDMNQPVFTCNFENSTEAATFDDGLAAGNDRKHIQRLYILSETSILYIMVPKVRAHLPLKAAARSGKRSLATAADVVYADETVASTELRQNASEIVSRVAYGGHNIIVTRNGKPAAALVPMRSLKLLQALENRIDIDAALLAKREIADTGTVSLADLKAELGL